MNSATSIRLVECETNLNEKLEAVYERITMRAYEKWLSRSAVRSVVRQQWFAAEKELLVKPLTDVREWAHGVSVRLVCPDLKPSNIRAFVNPRRLLILSPLSGNDERWLFRLLSFASPVDTADASAHYRDGVIEFTATFVNAPDDRKVHFQVA